ncbi:MAG: alpha/beta hydrolase [Flavobacteriaceae bacterium]|nr:alpha/beta hydrolase [Flavobacteriaceae bacterium]|tara:strand:+ start:394 stop:1323 length:930 start_codon:yes stop_codon:yes gene_type:complete
MKFFVTTCIMLTMGVLLAQEGNKTETIRVSPLLEGTLLMPADSPNPPLVILIAGSGPTDRDGNQNMMKNNSLKFLAEGLAERGIASFRYDKRIVKMIKNGQVNEKGIRFDDFIEDAVLVVEKMRVDDRFGKLYVLGHSQGSLVGMIAARNRADGFISIAGAGQEIDDVIVDQLAKQAPGLTENARQSFDDLRVNGVAQNFSPGLASIFRPDIQPFIFSWMQYNPQVEIAKLEIPVLILNGTKDLQVQISEAQALQEAKPDATFVIIEDMNHVFKEISGNDLENSKSYNQPMLPIKKELIEITADFILQK